VDWHCALDMDGVVTDFIAGAVLTHGLKESPYIAGQSYYDPVTGEETDIATLWNMTPAEFWAPTEKSWWAGLPKTPECDGIISIVRHYFKEENIAILSTPSLNEGCMPGKELWIRKHLPFLSRQYVFAPSKKFCARPTTILIDDRDKNVDEFRAAGGLAFLFPRPWNTNHPHQDKALAMLDTFICQTTAKR
jgi:hypothetical protein